MSAPAVDAVLQEYSGQISGDIYRETINQSPYLDLPKTEAYPEEVGKLQQVLTYDRSLPASPLEWADITTSNGENGGACVPPAQTLQITQTLREWNLQHTALHSPYFCTNDLRDALKAQDQMDQIMGILADNTAQALIDRNRSEYVRLSGHKMIATLGGLLDDDEWLAQAPTSVLTGGMLKKVYAKLCRLGGQKTSYGTVDGRPTFLGIGGMEVTERLFMEDGHRNDIRYSNRVPELLAPLGAERLYKGFWLTDDIFPPRHNLVDGVWTEVKPYVWSGGKLIDNPAYETATAEDFVIYSPEVYRLIVPNAPKNVGKAQFNTPTSYRGDWRWQNIEDEDKNPDKNIGRFRGVFQNGSKPLWPKFGFVIRFLRCDLPLEASACDES